MIESIKIKLRECIDVIAGSVLFITASTLIYFFRHFWDDELFTIRIVKTINSMNEIFLTINSRDIHPPLSYVLSKFFFNIFGSCEAILIPIILINLVALIYFYIRARIFIHDNFLRVTFLLFTFLNPNILMWSLSIRWYAYWLPLFVFVFTILFLEMQSKYSIFLAVVALSLMTYISYATFFALITFSIGYIIKERKINIYEWLIAGFIYLIISGYQLTIFYTTHLGNKPLVPKDYLMRFFLTTYTVAIGNSVLPVTLPAILMGVIYLWMFYLVFINYKMVLLDRLLLSIFSQILISLLLLIFSGIGEEYYRIAFNLNIIFILFLCLSFQKMNLKRFNPFFFVITFIFIIFSTHNVVLSKNTTKPSRDLPINELLANIEKIKKKYKKVYLFAHNPVIEYYLKEEGEVFFGYHNFSKLNYISASKGDSVAFIETYRGSMPKESFDAHIKGYNDLILSLFVKNMRKINLGFDKYSDLKSKFVKEKVSNHLIRIRYGELKCDVILKKYKKHKNSISPESKKSKYTDRKLYISRFLIPWEGETIYGKFTNKTNRNNC